MRQFVDSHELLHDILFCLQFGELYFISLGANEEERYGDCDFGARDRGGCCDAVKICARLRDGRRMNAAHEPDGEVRKKHGRQTKDEKRRCIADVLSRLRTEDAT